MIRLSTLKTFRTEASKYIRSTLLPVLVATFFWKHYYGSGTWLDGILIGLLLSIISEFLADATLSKSDDNRKREDLRPTNYDEKAQQNGSICRQSTLRKLDYLTNDFLPRDPFIHIASFLSTRDITNISCLNKGARDKASRCNQLWRVLWSRDYGSAILHFDWVHRALERSLGTQNITLQNVSSVLDKALDRQASMKQFYFSFGEAYVNYLLAGQNTRECCLLGMHGNIFDFTKFSPFHPGLSEPIMLECGKDATSYFEDLTHSKGARKIARRLVLVVNQGCVAEEINSNSKQHGLVCVAAPVSESMLKSCNTRPPQGGSDTINSLPMSRAPRQRRPPTLHCVRTRMDKEYELELRQANSWKSRLRHFSKRDQIISGTIRVYYDPFQREWKQWYSTVDLEPVFL